MSLYKNLMLYMSFVKCCAELALSPAWFAANGIFGTFIVGFLMIWRGVIPFFENSPILNWCSSFVLYVIVSVLALIGLRMLFVAPFQIWKKLQAESALRRISFLDLLQRAKTKGWVFNRDTLQEFALALRQAASEESVVIWGILKKGRDPISASALYVVEKIAASYFKEHEINAHQGWAHNENRYVSTGVPSGRNDPKLYSNLQVEKESALAWLDSIAK
jgi:hypothetical protein